jgi:molybdopterin-biosynthesis enzyme MoeA-like protein
MMEWVLDTKYSHLFRRDAYIEKSVIVFGAMEAALTPLMEQVEREHPQVKVFSLPSVDHPEYGRHIDLGGQGRARGRRTRPTGCCSTAWPRSRPA